MSCADVQTIQAGNGSKTQFSFDFPYLFKTEIEVSFWNATTKEWDVKATTDATYPWRVTDANPTIVEFTSTAPPSPATPVDPNESSVDNVRIRRTTSIDDIRALFSPGSAIRSDDLNKNFEQLRYAIQEANCQGVTDDVYQYLLDNYWDRFDNTLYSADTWRSDDATIATTAALDQRFQDEVSETFTKAELAAASNIMPNNDTALPTTGALNDYINEVITNDIGTDGTGITVTDDGDGTITLGLGAGSIDFDRIKDVDIITQAEERAGSPSAADTNLYTALAANTRFDTLVQTATPTRTDYPVGKTWLQNDSNLTLSVWNGTGWNTVSQGGGFTSLSKVVYVDATNGNDSADGHRISTPKQTIRAAVQQINAETDAVGNGSVVVVAPGVYAETFPIDIEKNDVSIVGTSLRNCIVHPAIPAADQAGYDVDVPEANELTTMFRVNSGSYFQNLTLMGMKGAGIRGGNAIDDDATFGLPTNQGWNFAFFPGATIRKSPYIQNCTNFSDSQINNVTFTPHVPGEGAAGDLDSGFAGGGILVDGSVPDAASPLRSMVADSYTHTALNGPGILVVNNGYVQITSSYAFFNHYHLKCLNGGQANLAASTTDFGRYSLIADGRSATNIFTANCVTGVTTGGGAVTTIRVSNGNDTGTTWHGSSTRPQPNMLLAVNAGAQVYPILSSVPQDQATYDADPAAYTGDWIVTISRPDPTNRSNNLGFSADVATGTDNVQFFLRSMVASSGHTMEYVGSGTDYRALPENGGVPVEANQTIERNNGAIWTAITDHNGKFTVGDFFEVDQQLGFVTIPEGSIAFDLLSDQSPQLGGNLDANGHDIILDTGAAATPSLTFDGDTNTGIYSPGADQLALATNGTNRLHIASDGKVGVGTSSPEMRIHAVGVGTDNAVALFESLDATSYIAIKDSDSTEPFGNRIGAEGNSLFIATNNGTKAITIDSSQRVGVGTTSPNSTLEVRGGEVRFGDSNASNTSVARLSYGGSTGVMDINSFSSSGNNEIRFLTTLNGTNSEALRIDSSGRVGVGTSAPAEQLELAKGSERLMIGADSPSSFSRIAARNTANSGYRGLQIDGSSLLINSNTSGNVIVATGGGKVGIGTTSVQAKTHIVDSAVAGTSYNADDKLVVENAGTCNINLIGSTTGANFLLFSDTTRSRGYIGYDHTNDYMRFGVSGSERARIDSSGRLLVGTSSTSSTGNVDGKIQVESTGSDSAVAVKRSSNNGGGPYISLGKSRGTGVGQHTIVQQDDDLGAILFSGADGNDTATLGASIVAKVDGTPGSNDMPGRLVFSTTADGASSPTERVRIESNGKTKFSGSVYGIETTITASDFDLNDGNFFTCGAIAIPNPTNGVAGMSGLIRVTAAPTSFGSNWDFPGGSYTAPTAFPAVAPFYIVSSTQFYLGNWTENIT